MTFYKFASRSSISDAGSSPESRSYSSQTSAMVSPFVQSSSSSSSSLTLSVELSIIANLVVAGLSILSLLVLIIIA